MTIGVGAALAAIIDLVAAEAAPTSSLFIVTAY
jgi:hypothetical protein